MAGIRETLLEGADAKRSIRFELYKLNVYGTLQCFECTRIQRAYMDHAYIFR